MSSLLGCQPPGGHVPHTRWTRPGRALPIIVGVLALAGSVAVLAPLVDGPMLAATWRTALGSPLGAGLALAAYLGAFLVRAALWQRVVPQLRLGQALAAIHLALAGNHLLPLRLGEALRVTSVIRRTGLAPGAATASTVVLRTADLLSVLGLALLLAPSLVLGLFGAWGWAIVAALATAGIAGCWWLIRLSPGRRRVRLPGPTVALGATVAWLLEAPLVWQAARWAGLDLSPLQALLITVVSVAAQVLAVAPGGLGTYEAAAVAAYVMLGHRPGPALAAALAAHAAKTAYALAAGAFALVVPTPGLLGRLRLPPLSQHPEDPATPPPGDGPVVLFLPAHNEVATVAGVVARVPPSVCGRRVQCLIVDDGSTDATARAAAAAGAQVVAMGANQGLGAAVRRGLTEALDRGAAAVAFCDADGEYDPAELERLVAPILAGWADYVVGSRFAGTIHHMLARRRLGNHLLTRALAFVARTPISDGQSGYRALSRTAAAAAAVGHDYNYAQVLTLDLLAKGYRYQEIPITYRYRTAGRSFVRPLRYLRRVIPAVWRELNSQSDLAGLGRAQGQAGGPRGVGGGRTVAAPASHAPRRSAGRAPGRSQPAWTGRPPLHKLPTDNT
jgi:uncharacterized membrane protein YbhN (UPF0104 family)